MNKNTFDKLINSNIVLAIVSFILTGLVGVAVSDHYQEKASERQRNHEILQRELDEAQKVLDEVTYHIRHRWYLLQKLKWGMDENDAENFSILFSEYNKTKDEWNVKLYIYKYKIRRLVDDELAYSLYHKRGERKEIKNRTLNGINIHESFRNAHNKFKDYKRYKEGTDSGSENFEEAFQKGLEELGLQSDKFIDAAYTIFLSRFSRMK